LRIHLPFLSEYLPETRIHKTARSLASAGHTVTVITLWRPGQALQDDLAGYRVRRLRLLSGAWRGRLVAPLLKWVEFSLRMWGFCLRHPAEAIQANDAKALPPAWLCAITNRAFLIYDARELETGREFGSFRLAGIYRRLWSLPEAVFIRRADAVITVSESIAGELERLYRIPRPVVVMNCPESRLPTPSNRLRAELGIPMTMRIALYQGSISAGRGIEPFLQAVQSIPGLAGVVLGDGPLLPQLRARFQGEAGQRVYLPGRVPIDQLPEYIGSADLGIALIQDTCLSHRYSLPNKLFEYIQAGIPVVASDLPEIKRIVRGFDVGTVVDPESSQAIASGIRGLLEDTETYSRVKANTRLAADRLTWEQESKKLLALYHALQTRKTT
jgi:glycosyltransferase involved in cell wall biosynthesis